VDWYVSDRVIKVLIFGFLFLVLAELAWLLILNFPRKPKPYLWGDRQGLGVLGSSRSTRSGCSFGTSCRIR
jgi:hypothetical protein